MENLLLRNEELMTLYSVSDDDCWHSASVLYALLQWHLMRPVVLLFSWRPHSPHSVPVRYPTWSLSLCSFSSFCFVLDGWLFYEVATCSEVLYSVYESSFVLRLALSLDNPLTGIHCYSSHCIDWYTLMLLFSILYSMQCLLCWLSDDSLSEMRLGWCDCVPFCCLLLLAKWHLEAGVHSEGCRRGICATFVPVDTLHLPTDAEALLLRCLQWLLETLCPAHSSFVPAY